MGLQWSKKVISCRARIPTCKLAWWIYTIIWLTYNYIDYIITSIEFVYGPASRLIFFLPCRSSLRLRPNLLLPRAAEGRLEDEAIPVLISELLQGLHELQLTHMLVAIQV